MKRTVNDPIADEMLIGAVKQHKEETIAAIEAKSNKLLHTLQNQGKELSNDELDKPLIDERPNTHGKEILND